MDAVMGTDGLQFGSVRTAKEEGLKAPHVR